MFVSISCCWFPKVQSDEIEKRASFSKIKLKVMNSFEFAF
jgi:hypothetical protein